MEIREILQGIIRDFSATLERELNRQLSEA